MPSRTISLYRNQHFPHEIIAHAAWPCHRSETIHAGARLILEVKLRPGSGKASADYPNYDKIITALSKETFESQREQGSAWIGTPDAIVQ